MSAAIAAAGQHQLLITAAAGRTPSDEGTVDDAAARR